MNLVDVNRNRPQLSPQRALQIAGELFEISGTIASMPSERDQNFCIDGEQARYVLKISASDEDPQVLDFQNRLMMHIAACCPTFAVPKVHQSTNKARIEWIDDANGRSHAVRMLSYLPGKPLVHIRPHSSELLFDVGCKLGQIDRALLSFDHPAARRTLSWDLLRAGELIRHNLSQIDDSNMQSVVTGFVDHFDDEIHGRLGNLRRSVIHNDANDHNLIVAETPNGQQKMAGIIDFGDALYSLTAAELAIACTYLMLGQTNPLAAACHVVRGYHASLPIDPQELDVLFDLIRARILASLSLAAARHRQGAGDQYLYVSQRPLRQLWQQLEQVHPQLALTAFSDACDRLTTTAGARLTRWLSDNRATMSPVTEVHLVPGSWKLIDMSVESPLATELEHIDTPAHREHFLFQVISDAGAHAGIGRYGEPRLVYQADQFKSTSDAPRTIHLGVDIFLPAGSPIYSPLPGRIHSFQDNALPLDYGPTIILEHDAEFAIADEREPTGRTFYTLYGHLSRQSLEGLQAGQPIAAGQQIATLGDRDVNGGWVPHLHFQVISHMLENRGDFPGVAPADAARIWMSICPDPNLILQIPDLTAVADPADRLQQSRRAHAGANLGLSYRQPLHIVKGSGQYLYSWHGWEFLDCVNNVAHVGHSHSHVVGAIASQAKLLNTNTRYLHENFTRYIERLLEKFPDGLEVGYLTCSGSEANELALRLAENETGGTEWIVMDHAYHGNTQRLVELSPYKFNGPGGLGSGPHTHVVPLPSASDPRCQADPVAFADEMAKCVGRAIEQIERDGKKLAGMLVESISGCGGQVIIAEGFMRQAFQRVRAAGGVCIGDEVQTGFGRIGTHFWAFETHGVIPDIVTLGKPIGNGHPMGAVITNRKIADASNQGMEYFNTFGGNPVSCAAGMAVLDVIDRDQLQQHAGEVGQYLIDQLQQLQREHSLIIDVRGRGLFLGVEMATHLAGSRLPLADYVVERMKQHRILLSTDGPLHNVIKIKPPMVFHRQNAERLCTALADVLGDSCLRNPDED